MISYPAAFRLGPACGGKVLHTVRTEIAVAGVDIAMTVMIAAALAPAALLVIKDCAGLSARQT